MTTLPSKDDSITERMIASAVDWLCRTSEVYEWRLAVAVAVAGE
jgi:hypothetical protein